ncbi:SH3 domain-containing protein [Patescibacteria group bacterium]|nr:SH3 domain-containing protein [Patescibacteria group bacterium]MBU0777293.1 SH3 domain-containing protein [Patescibacteria group bacterium]MBU0846278.1 SH3 domain-containing protein [Patescibacteria group bacterium]MBU0923181.1 SH3 domain-containing protein [Patescibacteria group bacterium]MBU1066895.1 SH3 domain-containing protein [Patescibacteria group bacterium]
MKISQKIFFVYCAILALFISISGILNITSIETALLQLVFLPVPIYFLVSIGRYLIQNKNRKKTKNKEGLPLGSGFSLGKGRVVFVVIIFLLLLATSARRILTTNKTPAEAEPQKEGVNINEYIVEEPKKFVLIRSDDASSEINVREESSTASEILGKVVVNEKYEYVSENENWFEIVFDEELTGWVHKDYAIIAEENNEDAEE